MAGIKTNCMRILDRACVEYKVHFYDNSDGLIDGISVAAKLGQPVENVYKTLVTRGVSKEHYIFVIPVAEELNLKAAARAVNEKAVEMIRVDEINRVTGYVRGGCSPLGMKKEFQTIVEESCILLESMIVSAGKIGCQVELSPEDLVRLVGGRMESVVL